MAIEVACGSCQGRLLVATPGVVVACPHCGTHLSIVAEEQPTDAPASRERERPEFAEFPNFDSPAAAAPAAEATEQAPAQPVDRNGEVPTEQVGKANGQSDFPVFDAEPGAAVAGGSAVAIPTGEAVTASSDVAPPPFVPPAEEPVESFPDFSNFAPVQEDGETEFPRFDAPSATPLMEVAATAQTATATAPPPAAPAAAPESTPPATAVTSRRSTSRRAKIASDQPMVARSHFMMVVSYASAVTLALIYLLMASLNSKTHNLESLPDVVPHTNEDGKILQQLVPEEAAMPWGHVLRVGEEQRFGNLKVQPLRITREPLHFVHYTGDSNKKQPPTRPVLKLWLKFENVSKDQTFIPLGRELLLSRFPDPDDFSRERANNFVCRKEDKSRSGHRVLVYNIPPEGNWDLRDQKLQHALRPGESFETYIATDEEGLELLQGDLIWRMHFRKGHNPQSGRGVTTLVEISFTSDEIQGGSAT